MAQQTAVELLIERIERKSHILHHLMKIRGEFEQAKQMEKEQIIEAYIHGINLVPCDVNSTDELDAEKYYNEIYGNNTPNTHT